MNLKEKHKIDISDNKSALRRLKQLVKELREHYLHLILHLLSLESLADGVDFFTSITKARFESLCLGLFNKCIHL